MKTPLRGESTKDDFIYARIEKELLEKIDTLRFAKGFKNRSQAIRCLISWSFENGLDKLDKPEKKKRALHEDYKAVIDEYKDEVIYTRIENNLLAKIDTLRESCSFDNRSQTVRGIISWAFGNGVEDC